MELKKISLEGVTMGLNDIEQSWSRSRRFGIDPHFHKPFLLSEKEFKQAIQCHQKLIDVTVNTLERLHETFALDQYVFKLYTADGILLKMFGDPNKISMLEKVDVRVGTVWREESIGTTATSLAIQTQQPVWVRGEEHFVARYQHWQSASAPIFQRIKNQMVGLLTVTAYNEVHALLLGVVTSLSEAIGESLDWSYRHIEQKKWSLSLMDHVDDLIMMIDTNGIIQAINRPPFYDDIFRQPFEVGVNYIERAFHGRKFNENGEYNSRIIETLETGREHRLKKTFKKLPNGREKVLLIDTKLLHTGQKVIGALMVAKDITSTTMMEEKLIQLDKFQTLSRLAAGLAHEIRNPLTSALGFIQLINRGYVDSKEDHLQIVEEELGKIHSLIQEFLLLSKPSAPHKIMTKLEDFLNSTVQFMQGEALLKCINCEYKMDDVQELYAPIDPIQMKQVLINLLKNSFDASLSGGRVEVSAFRKDSQYICICVRDWGCGMGPETVERIFDPFYTAKSGGTGLGLTICEQIVRGHGGRLYAQSVEGQGTTMMIEIPLKGDERGNFK
jgi:two-component system, sporulation sensor kinase E